MLYPTSERKYWIGPRKVARTGNTVAVYLGKEFKHLLGKKVMLELVVLEEEKNKVKT